MATPVMRDELNDAQLEAWEAFEFAHAAVKTRVERALHDAGVISLAWYDVLVALSHAEGQQLRMSTLADAVLLSRSGLTRLVDRIERAGLVRREAVESDARGAVAIITPLGLDAVEEAWPHYSNAISTYFVHNLNDADLRALSRALGKIAQNGAASD
jgi:DNA-binding MarR family transcriptional regulator